ncbi:hypothetical protein C8R45DRAFT_837687, partial [Mycena sanguinolenta]
ISWVGGLISAYELSGTKFPMLITKAKEVADKAAFAWIDGNANTMDFTTNSPVIQTINIAQVGTLTLEWSTLSKYTGNAKEFAEKGAVALAELVCPIMKLTFSPKKPFPRQATPFPGLRRNSSTPPHDNSPQMSGIPNATPSLRRPSCRLTRALEASSRRSPSRRPPALRRVLWSARRVSRQPCRHSR